jgi:hypothetical protein
MVPSHTLELNGSADRTEKARFIRCSKNFLIEPNQEVTEKGNNIFAIRCSTQFASFLRRAIRPGYVFSVPAFPPLEMGNVRETFLSGRRASLRFRHSQVRNVRG